MGINVRWDNDEHTIACLEMKGRWDWLEYGEAVTELKESYLAAVNHPVDLILDMQQGRMLPDNALANLKSSVMDPHPNWSGVAVLVGANAFVQAILTVITRVWARGQRYLFADSLEGARAILRERQAERIA